MEEIPACVLSTGRGAVRGLPFHFHSLAIAPEHMLSAAADARFHGGAPRRRRPRLRSCLASPPASGGGGGDCRESEKARRLLVERYQDGVSKRYILDGNSKLQIHQEKNEYMVNTLEEEEEDANSSIPRAIKDFVLPAGVCVRRLPGIYAMAITNKCNRMDLSHAGYINPSKGGRFGTLFDDDPKKWRMYADFIGSAGSIFELITPLYPGYFLPLASLGNLAKAVGRGFRDPSFRVIQNHFAESGNLGEVAAKEEVWEVGAQLLGLSIGVFIMDTSGIKSSYPTLALTWLGVRLLHLWFRYQSLSVLKFRTVNLKRARILVRSHVAKHTVPDYVTCNEEENILTWERFLHPQISFGVPMERMLGEEESSDVVDRLLKLYRNEKYILFLNPIGTGGAAFFVTFKEAATSMSVLRSLWQAHWLDKNQLKQDDVFSWLEESVLALEHGFPDFLKQMEIAGWDQNQIILKVPKEPILYTTTSLQHFS
uniref:Protein root UVB sensitive 5 n=1 Tax=Oryza nivara TaxID=4536 RepID=A0A0E0FQV9_ORYNI